MAKPYQLLAHQVVPQPDLLKVEGGSSMQSQSNSCQSLDFNFPLQGTYPPCEVSPDAQAVPVRFLSVAREKLAKALLENWPGSLPAARLLYMSNHYVRSYEAQLVAARKATTPDQNQISTILDRLSMVYTIAKIWDPALKHHVSVTIHWSYPETGGVVGVIKGARNELPRFDSFFEDKYMSRPDHREEVIIARFQDFLEKQVLGHR